jgi:hypothetical protein
MSRVMVRKHAPLLIAFPWPPPHASLLSVPRPTTQHSLLTGSTMLGFLGLNAHTECSKGRCITPACNISGLTYYTRSRLEHTAALQILLIPRLAGPPHRDKLLILFHFLYLPINIGPAMHNDVLSHKLAKILASPKQRARTPRARSILQGQRLQHEHLRPTAVYRIRTLTTSIRRIHPAHGYHDLELRARRHAGGYVTHPRIWMVLPPHSHAHIARRYIHDLTRTHTCKRIHRWNGLASPFPESQNPQAHGCGEGFSA